MALERGETGGKRKFVGEGACGGTEMLRGNFGCFGAAACFRPLQSFAGDESEFTFRLVFKPFPINS